MGACLDAGMELAKAFKDTPEDYARQQRAQADFLAKCGPGAVPPVIPATAASTTATGYINGLPTGSALTSFPSTPITAGVENTTLFLLVGGAALLLIFFMTGKKGAG